MQVLTLDKTWTPHSWISTNDAITAEAKGQVIEHLGESLIQYRGGENSITRHQSELITTSIIVLNGVSTRKYRATALNNNALFQRDRHVCGYCGNHFEYRELTRDHVTPVSKGGQDIWMNVVSACKSCNNLKSDLMPGERLGPHQFSPQGTKTMDLLYLPYIPCAAEAMIMRNRSIKADQMEFLIERIANKSQSRLYQEFKKLQ